MNRTRSVLDLPSLLTVVCVVFGAQALFSGSALAQVPLAQVDGWSSEWVGFSDAFDDGIHPDGSAPGEPVHFIPSDFACGTITDTSESGGTLTLAAPTDNCPAPGLASTVASSFLLASEGRVRVAFRLPSMLMDTNLGVGVASGGDFANLLFLRNGFGHFVAVSTDSDPSGGLLFDQVFPSGSLIELDLEIVQNPATNQMNTVARYRFCSLNPCESELATPFVPVGATGIHPAGAIDAGEAVAVALFATKLNADPDFAYQVEEWSIETNGVDEFSDAIFSDEVEYAFAIGDASDVSQAGGVLELLEEGEEGIVRLGFGDDALPILGGIPGEVGVDATYLWATPERCTSYGIGIEAIELMEFDFVNLNVVRTENLDTGVGEAVYVVMQSETETGNTLFDLFLDAPIVRRATLSTDPDNDPALAALTAIELSLGLVDNGSSLIPDAGYRLCTAGGCGATLPLQAHVAASNPTAQVCGADASVLDPPSDGTGQVDSLEQIGTVLTAVPEPSAVLVLAVGLVSIVGFGRRRR